MTHEEALYADALANLKWSAAGGTWSARVTPPQARVLLTKVEAVDEAVTYKRDENVLGLDEYEIANLTTGLQVLRQLGLDTGDWLGQILMKLPRVEQDPNVEMGEQVKRTRLRLRDELKRIELSQSAIGAPPDFGRRSA